MVLPIIVGVGTALAALTIKSTLSAIRKFNHLTPQMIASLNNIQLHSVEQLRTDIANGKRHKDAEHHLFLMNRYPAKGFDIKMTEREALMILGIEGDDIMKLDKSMLKERYRKLMVSNHPDHSGSQYLSQKINQAKDMLEESYITKH